MIEILPFQQLSEALSRGIGLHFPFERWSDLERGMKSASSDLGFADSTQLADLVLSGSLSIEHIKVLARHLTVPETCFYRDRATMHALRDQILTGLIRDRRESGLRLRVWSAGCCSGEEPYTLAILLRELLPDFDSWMVSVLGTDINPVVLAKAVSGCYGKWSFRDVPEGFLESYFIKKDKLFQVRQDFKQMVTFGFLNLATDPYPALATNTEVLDLILCRNVLMYFSREEAVRCVEKFHKCLTPGGWLAVSAGEASLVSEDLFDRVSLPDAVFFKKRHWSDEESISRSTLQLANNKFSGRDSMEGSLSNFESDAVPINNSTMPSQFESNIHDVEESKEDSIEAAKEYYEQGLYDEVILKLTAVLLKYPEQFEQGFEENNQVFVLLARSFANQGKLPEALHWCKNGMHVNPMDARLYYLSSCIFQSQQKNREALETLRKSLFLDPDFILPHYGLGNYYLKEGKKEKAAKSYKNALFLALKMDRESMLPEGEGLTAGRLSEIIKTILAAL